MAISESTRVRSETETRLDVLVSALTVELALYVVLAFAAFVIRFLLLGYAPLGASEARQAFVSWSFVSNNPASSTGSPLLFTGNALLFVLFGASDWVARLIPAVFGTVLVLLPALFRRELGRVGALVAAWLLSFSPSLVFYSRNLDGAIVAVTCGLAALAFAWRYLTERTPRDVYLACVFAALALVAGREVWTVVLAAAIFAGAYFPFLKSLAREHGDGAHGPESLEGNRFSRNHLVRGGILFAAVFILISTAFLFHLDGFGAAFDLFGAWIAGLLPGANLLDPLRLLIVYEPIALLFGLMALVDLVFVFRNARSNQLPLVALGIWVLVAFVLYSIGSDKSPARVVALVIPLALLAGWHIGEWLTRLANDLAEVPGARAIVLTQEGPVVAFACVLAVFIYFILAEYSTRGTVLAADLLAALFGGARGSAGFNGIVLTFLIAIAVAAVAFLAVTTVGWARARNIGVAVFLILGTAWTFRQMVLVSFSETLNAREWLIARATSPNVRDLAGDLEDISRWRANDSHTITLLVDDSLGPVIRWNLRQFPNARFQARPTMSPGIQALLLPAGAPINPGSLMSQHYRLEVTRSAIPQQDFLRWLIFRDSGSLDSSDVVLWIPQPQ